MIGAHPLRERLRGQLMLALYRVGASGGGARRLPGRAPAAGRGARPRAERGTPGARAGDPRPRSCARPARAGGRSWQPTKRPRLRSRLEAARGGGTASARLPSRALPHSWPASCFRPERPEGGEADRGGGRQLGRRHRSGVDEFVADVAVGPHRPASSLPTGRTGSRTPTTTRCPGRPCDASCRADGPRRQQPERDHDRRGRCVGGEQPGMAPSPGSTPRRTPSCRRSRPELPARHRVRERCDLGREQRRRHIAKIDAGTGKPLRTLPIMAAPAAPGAHALWASQRTSNRVVRIDPRSGAVVQEVPVGGGPTGIDVGAGSVWVANSLDGTVSRIDPETSSVTATIPTGDGPDRPRRGRGRRLGQQPVRRHGGSYRSEDEQRRATDQRRQPSSGCRGRGRRVLVRSGVRHRPPRRYPDRPERPPSRLDRPGGRLRPGLMAVPADDERRARRLQPGGRCRRDAARAGSGRLAADADRTAGGRTPSS